MNSAVRDLKCFRIRELLIAETSSESALISILPKASSWVTLNLYFDWRLLATHQDPIYESLQSPILLPLLGLRLAIQLRFVLLFQVEDVREFLKGLGKVG